MEFYENTFLRLAYYFFDSHVFNINDNDIMGISELLSIEYLKLKSALTGKVDKNRDYSKDELNKTNSDEYNLFANVFRYYSIQKSLQQISDKIDTNNLRRNISLFYSIFNELQIINSTFAIHECLINNEFTLQNALYFKSDFSPSSYIKIIELACIDQKECKEFCDIIPILTHILKYQFYTRSITLYFFTIIQIIMHSPYYCNEIKDMAKELYTILLLRFKNARIISVQVNTLFQDTSVLLHNRTKNTNNTTRMQILYGYENYDTYAVRLDLAHEGVEFVHFNNISPGGVKANIFTDGEYQEILKNYPQLKNCFIQYGKCWAMMEMNNCRIDDENKKILFDIQKNHEHDNVFSKIYSDTNIINFINLLGYSLPSYCVVPVDKEKKHAINCFSYDKIMYYLELLALVYLNKDKEKIDEMIFCITKKAVDKKLILNEDIGQYSCLEGVEIISEYAKEIIGLDKVY